MSLPAAGYLLQREAWYPGWRARVDGVDTPVLRADLLYRAMPLGAGAHDVEISFDSSIQTWRVADAGRPGFITCVLVVAEYN